MSAVFSLVVLSLTFLLVFKYYRTIVPHLRIYFWAGLGLKIFAGISLGLIYSYYYSVGDTFVFFEDAQRLAGLFYENPLEYFRLIFLNEVPSDLFLNNTQPRSVFFVEVLSALVVFSFNNYWIASAYLSLISFLGAWYAIEVIDQHYNSGTMAAVIAFLVVPSCLLWSSGIIKESLAVSALFFLAGVYLKHLAGNRLRLKEWVIIIVSVLLIWSLKYYWAVLFLACTTTTVITISLVGFLPRLKSFEIVTWIFVFAIMTLLGTTLHPNFYLNRIVMVIHGNYLAYKQADLADPFIHYYQFTATWTSLLFNSPWALLSALYRPFIFEANSALQIWIGIENSVLVILTVINIKAIATIRHSPHRLLLLSALTYIILLAIFLALSTPNFGTLSRYRVGFLPFLFLILLYSPMANGFMNKSKLTPS